ncbi:6330_t:CDS:2 [Paraglomus occultum]|uniref:6330_t:CDS:1 n=1 Tax=Paraglomus occultum TaxID=144539 RepID=A0A9N9GGR8_9GLOM|nr:6330_t:CDS:2 [Paraglomus occultum]
MDFDNYAADFQIEVDYKQWSVINYLRYLNDRVEFSSDSKHDIMSAFMRKFKKASKSNAILAGARQKATRLCTSVEGVFQRKEIIDFFEEMDQKFEAKQNNREVFKSVDTAKSVIAKTAATCLADTLEIEVRKGQTSKAKDACVRSPDKAPSNESPPRTPPQNSCNVTPLIVMPNKRPLENFELQKYYENATVICAFRKSYTELEREIGTYLALKACTVRDINPPVWTTSLESYVDSVLAKSCPEFEIAMLADGNYEQFHLYCKKILLDLCLPPSGYQPFIEPPHK